MEERFEKKSSLATKDHSTSSEVHGILKTVEEPAKKKSRIKWDEENLIYNEAHKSATMKIDEPKTPYRRDYDYTEESDGEMAPRSPSEEAESTGVKWTELEQAMQKAAHSPQKSGREKFELSDSESDTEENQAFVQKRKSHYNEYKLLQQWKEKQKTGDVEEEEEEEEKDEE